MKKYSIVKNLFAIAAAAALALSLGGCSDDSARGTQKSQTNSGESQAVEPAGDRTYQVAIIKQMDHPSLDEIAQAIEAELAKLASNTTPPPARGTRVP